MLRRGDAGYQAERKLNRRRELGPTEPREPPPLPELLHLPEDKRHRAQAGNAAGSALHHR